MWRIVAANVCQNGRYIFRHGIFTLGPLRAQRVLSSPEPSVRLSGVRPYESHCDRGKVFQAINFKLHIHTFGVWGQCSIDFQTDPTKNDPVRGGHLQKFPNFDGLTGIKARFFKQSISNFIYTLLGYGTSALLIFRQIQPKMTA